MNYFYFYQDLIFSLIIYEFLIRLILFPLLLLFKNDHFIEFRALQPLHCINYLCKYITYNLCNVGYYFILYLYICKLKLHIRCINKAAHILYGSTIWLLCRKWQDFGQNNIKTLLRTTLVISMLCITFNYLYLWQLFFVIYE